MSNTPPPLRAGWQASKTSADRSLDCPGDVFERFDFVVASIHGRLKLDRKAQTERLVKAISDPHTTIVGHMTGLQRRPG